MTIVIGVASVLLLAAVRRRAEIGILRSFGVSTAAISRIFLLQGSLIGLLGSLLGSAGGWAFCTTIVLATRRGDGSPALPVDPALGEYGTAILLATVASTLAAIFPARAAAQTDPYEVIHQ
jgi:lipoprotein-releasing system permease protein